MVIVGSKRVHELVFGHTVCGPLAALQNDWKEAEPPQNLTAYMTVKLSVFSAQAAKFWLL